jgi:uncharacterized membrane protein
LDVGAAFTWAWNKFTKNVGPLLVPAVVYALVMAVLGIVIYFGAIALLVGSATVDTATSTYDPYTGAYSSGSDVGFAGVGFFGFFATIAVGGLLFAVLGAAIQSAYLGGILDIADGKPVEIGTFFKPRNFVNVLLAGLLVGLAAGIGSFCIVGSIVVGYFAFYTSIILVDRGIGAIDGIKASFEIAKNNFVPTILTYLCMVGILLVGELACGIGIVVALPVAQLFLAYAYRRITGGQVAPLTP